MSTLLGNLTRSLTVGRPWWLILLPLVIVPLILFSYRSLAGLGKVRRVDRIRVGYRQDHTNRIAADALGLGIVFRRRAPAQPEFRALHRQSGDDCSFGVLDVVDLVRSESRLVEGDGPRAAAHRKPRCDGRADFVR